MENIDKLNIIFDKHQNNFTGSFHSVLWKILMDNITGSRVCCFYREVLKEEDTPRLGIVYANETGWAPLPVAFTTQDWKVAADICNELNKTVFNVDEKQALEIVTSSMFAAK